MEIFLFRNEQTTNRRSYRQRDTLLLSLRTGSSDESHNILSIYHLINTQI